MPPRSRSTGRRADARRRSSSTCRTPAPISRPTSGPGIHLDDPKLARELLQLTDHRADALAGAVLEAGATRFVNRYSRLVVDPERFPDEREERAVRGMGAVCTHGSDRQPIRWITAEERAELVSRFFTPYVTAFATESA